METNIKQGNLKVHTENIFPIIKKFLYSDHEIFLRELVSNAVDASQKMKMLVSKGDYEQELGKLQVKVAIDKDKKTLTISDNGIGMTADEVEKYINLIAFSSAEEFVEKFKDLTDKSQIIGHFGLGFYSSFMVADKVEIFTKSYKDEPAVRWECEGQTQFSMEETNKESRGTDVVLHINSDSEEFLEEARIQNLLEKYCRFMPIEIEFKEEVINSTEPLWLKKPTDISAEEYKEFYNKLYPFSQPPLFWIHLNIDYPFRLTGILYFPKINNGLELQKNKIQLYSNQVFVTDSVENIVPDFLMLLHGVIDSPDIPLNVSRSYLQSDGNVKKISSYIVKKVADKMHEIFKNDRTDFESKWKDINVFVKYGILSDEKFYEKAKNFCLLKNTDEKLFTIEEYNEKTKTLQTDKDGNQVWLYTNDVQEHDSFIDAAQKRSYDVLVMDELIDSHFIQHLESKQEKLTVKRIDADAVDKLIDKDEKKESALSSEQQESLKELMKEVVPSEKFNFETEALSPDDAPIQITRNEFMRRMEEMSKLGGGMGMMGAFPENYRVVINTNHPIAKQLATEGDDERKKETAAYIFDLARLSQNMLKGKELTGFINKSLGKIS